MSRSVPFDKYGKGLGLYRTQAICRRIGIDPAARASRTCVIVGSNGKGSTAAMTQAVLTANGYRTALFTSPHLRRFNERYRLDDQDISDAQLDRHWRIARSACEAWIADNPCDKVGGFEFMFVLALSWIEEIKPDFMVMEAGIGGRYDPTRLLQPAQAALVSLDLEHTELLGHTLPEIAFDKADVCPPGGLLFTGTIPADVMDQLEMFAGLRDIRLRPVQAGRSWRAAGDGIEVSLPGDRLVAARPALRGSAQAANAALACHLADQMTSGRLSPESTAAGLSATRWPGRLEIVCRDPLTVIDVGHSPEAIEAALEGLGALGRFQVLVCGASHDKSAAEMVARLAPHFSRIVCTAARHKGSDPAKVAEAARAAHPAAAVHTAPTPEAAWAIARDLTRQGEGVYVAGGLFLAIEVAAAVLDQTLEDPFF